MSFTFYTDKEEKVINHKYTAWIDGACVNNPGGLGGYGYLIKHQDKIVLSGYGKIEKCTNNEAEYIGLIKCIEEYKIKIGKEPIMILSDSQMMVEQINSRWRIRTYTLVPFYNKAMEALNEIDFTLKHIYRHYNTEADALAELGLTSEVSTIL